MLRAPFALAAAPPPRRPGQAGFTLIEVMIAIVVIAILAAIAYPTYNEFVMRSRIVEATSGLNDFKTRMEQYFQDNRTFANGGNCGLPDPAFVPGESNFQIQCSGAGVNGYTLDANGNAAKGMGAFRYRLVVSPVGLTRSTVSVHAGWALPAPNTCWAVRKNGKCA